MKRPPNRCRPAPGASLIRQRGDFLGNVEAPDRTAAEAAAVERFKLSDEQRGRYRNRSGCTS